MTENRKTQTDELIAKLQRMIDSIPDEVSDHTLKQQNDVLNGIFKRLISDCDDKNSTTLHRYSLALRAQSQFIRTLAIMKKIEKNDTV